jgi:hypothetical protein
VFYVRSTLCETLFHCNILSKRHYHQRSLRFKEFDPLDSDYVEGPNTASHNENLGRIYIHMMMMIFT